MGERVKTKVQETKRQVTSVRGRVTGPGKVRIFMTHYTSSVLQLRLYRLRKNSFGVSFRGAPGDEESRIVLKTLRARFLAPLGTTAWKVFPHPV